MKTTLILASSSPRRIEMLKNLALNAQILKSDIDESRKLAEKPSQYVSRLSRTKALTIAHQILNDPKRKHHSRTLILGADTTVALSDSLFLEKPSNAKEAVQMLNLIQGKTHTVLTGYTIVELSGKSPKIKKQLTKVIKTKVSISPLSKAFINSYVASKEPLDKAGAYAAQGIGMAFIEKVQGSYSNVIGLPLTQVLYDLKNTFSFSSWEHF